MSETSPQSLVDRNGDRTYKAPRVDCKLADFKLLRRAGEGSFSTVVKSLYRTDGNIYAIKIVDKSFVTRHKQLSRILLERNVLDRLDDEGIVQLKFTFQDTLNLYLVMEYIPGGELFSQIHQKKKLSAKEAQFYAAEVVLILEYLRKEHLVHRDLKPENLLLTADGHLKLIDFGCVKDLSGSNQVTHETERKASFVGTADYLAPETLRNEDITFASDLWGFGCLLYQMLVGNPPFRGASEYLTYENISKGEFSFLSDVPSAAQNLVENLLQSDPKQRIGTRSLEDVKNHDFFDGTPWTSLRQSKAPDFIAKDEGNNDEEDDNEASELDWELNSLKEAISRMN